MGILAQICEGEGRQPRLGSREGGSLGSRDARLSWEAPRRVGAAELREGAARAQWPDRLQRRCRGALHEHGLARLGSTWLDLAWLSFRLGSTWLSARLGSARLGLARLSSARRSARLGSAELG